MPGALGCPEVVKRTGKRKFNGGGIQVLEGLTGLHERALDNRLKADRLWRVKCSTFKFKSKSEDADLDPEAAPHPPGP